MHHEVPQALNADLFLVRGCQEDAATTAVSALGPVCLGRGQPKELS